MADTKPQAAQIERLEDGTIKLTISIPWNEVKRVQDEIVNEAVSTAELPGFRKGKAPKEMVEKSLNPQKVTDEVLKRLLPQMYIDAVQKNDLRPIINPKIQIEKLNEGEDWVFSAQTAEMPEVILGNYKDAVQKITAKSKIAVPGKEPQEPNFDEIMKAVTDTVKVKIPKILTEQEVDRLLAHTLDEIKKLGLTLDQYLASTGKTAEDMRKDYEQKAEHDIKVEFTLQKIAESEKLVVEEPEIDEAIQKAKDPQEKANLEANRYLLANILRQQKTLDFLKNL